MGDIGLDFSKMLSRYLEIGGKRGIIREILRLSGFIISRKRRGLYISQFKQYSASISPFYLITSSNISFQIEKTP